VKERRDLMARRGEQAIMSKSLQRIAMLMLLGAGLSFYGIYQMIDGIGGDRIPLGLLYLAAGVVAFVAVLRLPTKPVE
jgi:hypothetical protein